MKILKDHGFFIVAFTFTIAVFLYPLISMKSSFLYGDNFVQFYPWFKCYSESIKHFSLPYWIREMGGGFPLMAEGQIGGYYPLNLAIFFALPFKAAYNYSIILHFILGGVFTYLYARKAGADKDGGYLASLLFCFGSAYAGCFYNIITLHTLVWFPLALLLFEIFFDNGQFRYIILAGLTLGMQFLAGFVQMAAYSAFFYLAYFLYRAVLIRSGVKKVVFSVVLFFVSCIVVASPQLILTFQMASLSGRKNPTIGFALWRSFSPLGLLGLVFPQALSFSTTHFYVGIVSLAFIIYGFYVARRSPLMKAVILILFLSIFFAFGWFNPVYVLMLKMTKLYFFRNPSKFLFFGAFALSIISGLGYTNLFKDDDVEGRSRIVFLFRSILIASAAAFFITKYSLLLLKPKIIDLGHSLVENFIYNKPHHRYPLSYYLSNFDSLYGTILSGFSFSDIFTIISWLFIIVAIFIIPILIEKRMRALCISLIFIDLAVFSFYGIGYRGNLASFTTLSPEAPGIFNILKSDPEIFRILPFGIKSGKLPNWSIPNANAIYGLDSVACYTPLAGESYKNRFAGLEIVDDSLGLKMPDEKAIGENLENIRFMNVKYIISNMALNANFLEEIKTEKGAFLYRLKDHFPRVFFSRDIDKGFKALSLSGIKISSYKNGLLELEINAGDNGFIVFSENYYPGWRVYVDGKEKELIRVKGFLQGVAIENGSHKIRFVYEPYAGLV